MQPHDPQPMAMQQHGGRIKLTPRAVPSPPAVAARTDEASTDGAPRPDRPRDSD